MNKHKMFNGKMYEIRMTKMKKIDDFQVLKVLI